VVFPLWPVLHGTPQPVRHFLRKVFFKIFLISHIAFILILSYYRFMN